MDVDDHRNDEDDPPRDLRDNLLLMQVLSEVVHRVGAARDNLVETQKVARFFDEIPFDRSGLEKAARALHLLNEAFESLNAERLSARDTLTDALGFLDAIAEEGVTRPDRGSQPAASND